MRTAAFLLLIPCLIAGQQLVEVCDPADFIDPSGPSLPSVAPNQFSATIEGNLVARSQTFVITEYYDQVNDRGKIEFAINGTREVGIYDYTNGEVFLIPDPQGGDCRVFPITPNNSFLRRTFGFTLVNGSIHIGSPTTFLDSILQNASTIFKGEDIIRGIPVRHWQSCVALPNNSYLMDFYFASQSNWTYGSQADTSVMIPIQFNLNASFYSARRDMIDNAYNIYTFVDYRTGPESVPDDIFTVPTGLGCLGRKPGQPIPALSNYFSGRFEVRFDYMDNPILATQQVYYDSERGLFRDDYYDRDGPVSLVHDFNQGVQFRISQNTNKCVVTRLSDLPPQRMFDFDSTSNTPSIASPYQIALLESSYNYSYEGVSTIRGIEVDSWVSVRDFEVLPFGANVTNAVYEVFFTRPGVIAVTEHSVTKDPVIVRVKLSGNFYTIVNNSLSNTTRSFQYDYFDVSTKEPPYDAYDVSSCYEHENVVSLALLLPECTTTGYDLGVLRESIRVGISNYTGVLPLQVAGVNMFHHKTGSQRAANPFPVLSSKKCALNSVISKIMIVDSNGTTVFVHVRIANLSMNSTIAQNQRVSAGMALEILMNGVTSTTRPFTITFPPNNTVKPFIHAFGQGPNNPSNCPTTPPPTICPTANTNDLQNQLNLKNRELIGIAIGLLFGGILVGALLMLLVVCICRCICGGRGGSYKVGKSVQYKKHDDDVAFDT